MAGITRRDFINYSVLPGVAPRLKDLFMSGFQHISFFMALVYQAVRLLPPGHAYTNPANIGKFGIRHVIAEAANNLVISRKNIDQILLFATLLVGVVIIVLEIGMFVLSIAAGSAAMAMPTNFQGFFLTPAASASQDLAYMMFDLIFGIPKINGVDFFGSCFATKVACNDIAGTQIADGAGNPILNGLGYPFPIHEGLHAMFNMYNVNLMVIAMLITIYYLITILMETAQTGNAFGKRFNKVWSPIRMVMAFGLLMPFGLGAGGLNSAQFIVLYAAKFGSGFATNGWKLFNNTLVGGYTGDIKNLVSQTGVPEMNGLIQFIFTAGICWELEFKRNGAAGEVWPYLVKDNVSTPHAGRIFGPPGASPPGDPLPPGGNVVAIANYQEALNFAAGAKQLVIRFGRYNEKEFPGERGHVSPICGELVIPLSDPRSPTATAPAKPAEKAAVDMQAYYFGVMKELWYATFVGYQCGGTCARIPTAMKNYNGPAFNYAYHYMQAYAQLAPDPNALLPDDAYKSAVRSFYQDDIKNLIGVGGASPDAGIRALDPAIGANSVLVDAAASPTWITGPALLDKGWAAAGIWYNRIAEMNGLFTTAVLNVPVITLYPAIMEKVKNKKMQQDMNMINSERFSPKMALGKDVPLDPGDQPAAVAMWEGFYFWESDQQGATAFTAKTNNPVLDLVNQLFGTSGLYSMRKNPTVHPLAQLVGVGRSLIEAATRSVGYAAGATLVGSMAGQFLGASAGVAISFLMTIVTIALTAGFVLYYMLPFMPFIYYFFAVCGWFKAIFEAMVGAPLWALAHLRIDGPGLSGQAALQGYFLILEIFLRPILIVFGLLASISVFAAMVAVLNDTWQLVYSNLSGFDVETEVACSTTPGLPECTAAGASMINYYRGPVDEFFFTVIYTIVVYIMAMSSFKLIDRIPANILRWMGQSFYIFNDVNEDAGQALMGTATIGAQQATSAISGNLSNAMQSFAKSK